MRYVTLFRFGTLENGETYAVAPLEPTHGIMREMMVRWREGGVYYRGVVRPSGPDLLRVAISHVDGDKVQAIQVHYRDLRPEDVEVLVLPPLWSFLETH